ncbi:hypothetical protein VB713_01930 [Anabaena cylindrica UHCC 0172]|nr:hypothetical protein [Anabaena cylindrica]MEA5549750.1 hypothetical protein [Anabaena cylindrica UHCC 0172]
MMLNKLLETQRIIHCDSEIMSGVPVFVGTRVPFLAMTNKENAEDV